MEKIIAEFEIDTGGVVEQAMKLKAELDELIETNKKLRTDGKASTEAYVKNEARIKALRTEYNSYSRTLQRAEQANITNADSTKLLNIALNQEANTIEQLRNQNAMLNSIRNRTNIETEEGRKQLALINSQLDENNARIKENVDSYTQQKINIGNYSESVKDALLSNELFGGSIREINETFSAFAPLSKFALNFVKGWASDTKKATKAQDGMNKAGRSGVVTNNLLIGSLKLLRLAILSTGIGAVVVLLGSLISYLTTTQSGINAVSKVTVPLREVLKSTFEIFQNLGKIVFDSPLESLKSIYDFVKKQLVVTLKGVWDIMAGIATFDFDRAKKGLQDMKDNANENEKAVKKMWNSYAETAQKAWERGKRIQELNEDIAEMEIDMIDRQEDISDALIEQEKIMRDNTLSVEDRAKAADRILEITNEQLQLEKELAEAELERLELINEAGEKSYEDRKAEAEARAKIRQINRKIDDEELRQVRVKSRLHDEENRKLKEALQLQAERGKAQIKILEAENALFKKTSRERLDFFEEIYEKELVLQEQALKNGMITQEDYNLFVIEKANERSKILQEIAIELAEEENRIAKRKLEDGYKERRRVTEEEFNNRLEFLKEQNKIEDELEKEKLEQNQISSDEYLQGVKERFEAEQDLIKELEEIQREQDKEEQAEIDKLEEDARLDALRESLWSEYEFKAHELDSIHQQEMADLRARLEDGEISERLYQAKLLALKNDYDKKRLDNSKALAKQEIDLYKGMLANITGILGEESKAGKAFAIAQALWNTYEGITAGLKLPFPANIPAVGFATKTGFDAVKNISKTNVGDTGGGSTSAPTPSEPINFRDTGVREVDLNIDMEESYRRIGEAVRDGSEQGTRRGSRLNLIDERINEINTL